MSQLGQDGGSSGSKVYGTVLIPPGDGIFPVCLRMLNLLSIVLHLSRIGPRIHLWKLLNFDHCYFFSLKLYLIQ